MKPHYRLQVYFDYGNFPEYSRAWWRLRDDDGWYTMWYASPRGAYEAMRIGLVH